VKQGRAKGLRWSRLRATTFGTVEHRQFVDVKLEKSHSVSIVFRRNALLPCGRRLRRPGRLKATMNVNPQGRPWLQLPTRLRVDQLIRPSLRPHLRPLFPSFHRNMTSNIPFKQEPHKLLVIPGPIEVADDVLYANAHPSMSHTSPNFIKVFGDCIRMIRTVLYSPNSQPFLIAGSGTLGWDQVASNLVQPGENVLVLNSGYFGDSFADCLETYGAQIDQVQAKLGEAVQPSELEAALQAKTYKLVTMTHVDTSTGVLTDAKTLCEAIKRISPNTLVVLDGVCSVASEEIHQEEWGIDVVLTATQKGLGTPPGLSIVNASQLAIKAFSDRSTPPGSYYASWKRWLPIMQAYEAGRASYFATPPVNLVYAFHASLTQITKGVPSLEERFQLHREASQRVKDTAEALGLKQVAVDSKYAANGMTALYFPTGLTAADIVPKMADRNVTIAAGLHKDIKERYFRIGHMGISVVDRTRGDIDKVLDALTEVIKKA